MTPQQFGRYKVIGSLGMGAMGCVYEGFDPHGSPIRREAFMNRSSFRCPRCQRVPRHARF